MQCMACTHQLRASRLSAPQLPYSWVGFALSWPRSCLCNGLCWLSGLPVPSLKCHVSADSVLWGSVSIKSDATLWRPMSHRFTCVALSFVSALPFILWSLWALSNAFLKFYLVSHICRFKHFHPSLFSFIDQFVLQMGVGIGGIGMCWEWVPNCFLPIQIAHHRQQHFSGLQKRSVELSLFITLLTPQLDPSYAHILRTHLHPFTYPGSLSLGFNWSDVPHCETAQWQWRAPLSDWMRAGVFIRWAWMVFWRYGTESRGLPKTNGVGETVCVPCLSVLTASMLLFCCLLLSTVWRLALKGSGCICWKGRLLFVPGGRILVGQNKDWDQRWITEKQRPPPLMEIEREPMSLGPGEVSSFHSLHFRHQSFLVVQTKIPTTTRPKKVIRHWSLLGIFFTLSLTHGGQGTGSAEEQHLLQCLLLDSKI